MTKKENIILLVILLFFTIISVNQSPAFKLMEWLDVAKKWKTKSPSDAPPFGHWDLRKFPDCKVPYSINPNTGDIAAQGEIAPVEAAANTWNNVSPSIIILDKVANTGINQIKKDDYNAIFWGVDDKGTLGGCLPRTTGSGEEIYEADIKFNDRYYSWVTTTTNTKTNVQVYSVNAQPFDFDQNNDGTIDNNVLNVKINGTDNRVCTFKKTHFANINAATHIEVMKALDNEIGEVNGNNDLDAWAYTDGTVGIESDYSRMLPITPTTGEISIQVTGGSANTILNFPVAKIVGSFNVDIQTVALHELGHFIGLDHTSELRAEPKAWKKNAVMYYLVSNGTRRVLTWDDEDGCNFLYTPDLGDAEDPYLAFNKYPSKVHSTVKWKKLNDKDLYNPADGAVHLYGIPANRDTIGGVATYEYEWLGKKMDNHQDECESRQIDEDDFDDGVAFTDGFQGGNASKIKIRIKTTGLAGRYVSGNANKRLYLHGWFDWNGNGVWTDAGELALWWTGVPGTTDLNSANMTDDKFLGNDIQLEFNVTPGAGPPELFGTWARFRLDYAEDGGVVANTDGTLDNTKGAAQFGEVEDYWVPLWVIWDIWPLFNYTFGLSISSTSNLGYHTDTTGFYLVEDDVNLLYDGSPVMGFISPDNDTLVGRHIYDDFNLFPVADLVVDTFTTLKTIVAQTEFWPVKPFSFPASQYWPWWRIKQKTYIFYSGQGEPPFDNENEQYIALQLLSAFHDEPPEWWPEIIPPDSIPLAYLGMLLDANCPSESGTDNWPGTDDSRRMAFIQGYGGDNENYRMGIAQRDTCFWVGDKYCCWPDPNTIVQDIPFAIHLLRNDVSVYPAGGYDDDSLYIWMSTPGDSVHGDGNPGDYSILTTGRVISAHSYPSSDTHNVAYALVASDELDIDKMEATVDMIMCGNANRDMAVTIADVVYLITYMFRGGEEPWLFVSDVDGNSQVDIADAVYLVSYLFRAGPPPKCSSL